MRNLKDFVDFDSTDFTFAEFELAQRNINARRNIFILDKKFI